VKRWLVIAAAVVLVGALAVPAIAQVWWHRNTASAEAAWQPPAGIPAPASGTGTLAPYGPSMMGLATWGTAAKPVDIDQAAAQVQQFLASAGYKNLVVSHVMEFSNDTYVVVKEKDTGKGAFELLVTPYGITWEPQAMMWNTKYGHMAGWSVPGGFSCPVAGLGGGYPRARAWSRGSTPVTEPGTQPAPAVLTLSEAQTAAQQYLDQAFPGAKVSEGTEFYGYYTFDFDREGQVAGMLSVNAYTGRVWYHSWHAQFIAERDIE